MIRKFTGCILGLLFVILFSSAGAYNIEGEGICNCDSCSDCNSALNDNSDCISTVKLTANVSNYVGTCISSGNFNNKVFDCQGRTINGQVNYYTSMDFGILLYSNSGNTIKNCIITGFSAGIGLGTADGGSSSNNTLINNIANSNDYCSPISCFGSGFWIVGSPNNKLINNTANSNNGNGILVWASSNNTLTDNIANSNGMNGIFLRSSPSNTLINNIANSNTKWWDGSGIYVDSLSDSNTLTNNTANSNWIGIKLDSPLNILTSNKAGLNTRFGIIISSLSTLINNNASSNSGSWEVYGIYVSSSSNILINNTANSNGYLTPYGGSNGGYGIYLASQNNTLINNTANSNTGWANWGYGIYASSNNNNLNSNTANSNGYGIYFQYSSNDSTLNENKVCSNIRTDIYNSGTGNSGDNNICDTSTYWGDDSAPANAGCRYACDSSIRFCTCNSCSDCTDKLNNASCPNVYLTENISNYAGTCIDNPENLNNKTFDCQGHTISGVAVNGYSGIYLNGKKNNMIKSCTITDFVQGIYLDSSSNNTLTSNKVNTNYNAGIYLSSSSNNSIINNTANSDGWRGIYLSSSSNNSIINNTANSNGWLGIYLDSSSNSNTLISNTANSNGWWGIYLEGSNNNLLSLNTAQNNSAHGIFISSYSEYFGVGSSLNNILNQNTFCSNNQTGDPVSYCAYWYRCGEDPDCLAECAAYTGTTGYDIFSINETNTGTNNICTTTNNWNDLGTTGCTYTCEMCICSSCEDCTNKLNDTSCSEVYLTADIIPDLPYSGGACIDDPANFNNKVFDCQGHTISKDEYYYYYDDTYGISLKNKQNDTIKNCVINGFDYGISLWSSSSNTLTNNTANLNNWAGIWLESSSNSNIITNNALNSNSYGLVLISSSNNNLTSNTAESNYGGIDLWSSSRNTLTSNIANSNYVGIELYSASNNTLTSNIANSNTNYGIYLYSSSDNILIQNTAKNNFYNGLYLYSESTNNIINENLFCSNNQNVGEYYDIFDEDSNTGDDNLCDTTSNWDDDGTTGCTYTCPDTTLPLVNLISPANSSTLCMGDIDFVCNSSDEGANLNNVTLYLWNSSSLFSQTTQSVSGASASASFEIQNVTNGTYLWNCKACDNASNCEWASSNFSLNLFYPTIKKEVTCSNTIVSKETNCIIKITNQASYTRTFLIEESEGVEIKGSEGCTTSEGTKKCVSNLQKNGTTYLYASIIPVEIGEISKKFKIIPEDTGIEEDVKLSFNSSPYSDKTLEAAPGLETVGIVFVVLLAVWYLLKKTQSNQLKTNKHDEKDTAKDSKKRKNRKK